ncbi:MAG: flippase-like domain-containing protein [Candidatus Bathyarchaeota archaeon]|nr:flippase-like domain-containing protein [Candidatus Bathyarchaeota archaeon]
MTAANKVQITKKTIILPILGIAAFLLYVYFFNVDILEIIATAQTADPLFYSAAILLGFAEIFFYAVSWRSLLAALKVKISVVRSFLYTWYGMFMDLVIPAESIAGEVCRIFLVNREKNGTQGKTVASVVAQRILGMAINVAVLILGITFLFDVATIRSDIFFFVVLFTAGITGLLILLLLISWKEPWSKKIINGVVRIAKFVTRGRWEEKIDKLREQALFEALRFHDSMKEFGRNPKSLVLPTIFMALNWLSSLAIPYFVFLSLGYPVSWTIIFITMSIVVAVKSIPIGVPFEVGLPEITMMGMFQLMGVPVPISATATVLTRIITMWMRVGIGFGVQQWVELKCALLKKDAAATADVEKA